MYKIILLILVTYLIIRVIYYYIIYRDQTTCNNKSKEIIKRNINIDFPTIKEENTIPKNILQTHQNIELVPGYVISNIKNKNLEYTYYFYDDDMIEEFILKYFGQSYLDKMNSFEKGAHRADLFRMCWLYLNGGVYIDIDLELLESLDNIVGNNFSMPLTTESGFKRPLNAFMFVNKGNSLVKECILNIMKTKQEDLVNNYLTILYIIKNTIPKNFKYELEEKKSIDNFFYSPNDWGIYKNNKKIANSRYKNYKEGKFN